MSTYDVIKRLCDEKQLAITALEKELGFGRGSIGKLRSSNTSAERLQKIADYFGVTVAYLMTGEEKKETTLTPRDERDIAKDLDEIMNKIESGEDGPLRYNGDEIDSESLELLRDAIGMSLKHLKIINKEKYNPNKNKK